MLRDNLVGSSSRWLAAREPALSRCAPVSRNRHRTIDPIALKIPAPKGRNLTPTENVASPFHAEPEQKPNVLRVTWDKSAGGRTISAELG
jgi:hypothetical protein